MISNSGHDENGKISGGRAGDQTGTEWQVQAWYNRPWTHVIRFEPRIARMIASLAEEAAANDRIGYDQIQRTTFWDQLKVSGYHPAWIRTACEADCSAGVLSIVKAVGYLLGDDELKAVDQNGYTGNMREILTAAGAVASSDPKYLTSDNYLARGDILLNEGHHTAINLSTGSEVPVVITSEQQAEEEDRVNEMIRHGGYTYGDSKTLPPCADHFVACDRGDSAWPLWNLGFTDQPNGGITVLNMEAYLRKWGFAKNVDEKAVTDGHIVLMRQLNTSSPTAAWHTYYVIRRSGDKVVKYDYGSQQRINDGGRFTAPINEWSDKVFYCSFYLPEGHPSYKFSPSPLSKGSKNASAYLMTEILKARGYRGVKDKDGAIQPLELNFEWTRGDMTALAYMKADRARNGATILVNDGFDAGEAGPVAWKDVLGSDLPFEAKELPTKEQEGTSVLLCQEILRARGIKGADGKQLALDQKWGTNTESAVMKYQKARGRSMTGIVDADLWKDLLGGI